VNCIEHVGSNRRGILHTAAQRESNTSIAAKENDADIETKTNHFHLSKHQKALVK
jgi:hypothetical protein